jgi:hypothetical protein
VKWGRENGCSWDAFACSNAAKRGHFPSRTCVSLSTSWKTTATSSTPSHETVGILKYFEEIGILTSENGDEFLCRALVHKLFGWKMQGDSINPYLFKDLSRNVSKNSPKIPSSLFLFLFFLTHLIFPVLT